MKDIQNSYLYLIPYITICGALYHLTYWDTFNINGFSMINITDIVKSAFFPVFPLLITIAYLIFINSVSLKSIDTNRPRKFMKNGASNYMLLLIYITIRSIISLIFYYFDIYHHVKFYFDGLLIFVVLSAFLYNNDVFIININSEKRKIIILTLVAIPVTSYYSGLYDSVKIYENFEYKYTTKLNVDQPTSDNQSKDTLKYLGITDKHFVFTDLKNSRIILVKSDNVNSLTLFEKNNQSK